LGGEREKSFSGDGMTEWKSRRGAQLFSHFEAPSYVSCKNDTGNMKNGKSRHPTEGTNVRRRQESESRTGRVNKKKKKTQMGCPVGLVDETEEEKLLANVR